MTNLKNYIKFSKYYREILKDRNHFTNQFEVIEKILIQNSFNEKCKILDASCGTGDVIEILYKKGFRNLYGTDGCSDMLEYIPRELTEKLIIEKQNWSGIHNTFEEYGLFDVVYILGHSLPHSDYSDLPAIFEHIYEGLNNNGIFIFDIRKWSILLNGNKVQSGRSTDFFRVLGEYKIGDEVLQIKDRVSYCDGVQIVTYRIFKNNLVWEIMDEFTISYTIFGLDDIQPILTRSGFCIENIEVESYDNWPYELVVCKKKRNNIGTGYNTV